MAIPDTAALYLRDDLGSFSGDIGDDQLERNWDRVTDAGADGILRHDAVLGLCYRQLVVRFGKLRDYDVGEAAEKMRQVTAGLERRAAMYDNAVESALADAGQSEVVKTVLGAETTGKSFPS